MSFYTGHLRNKHRLHWNGSEVTCGQNGCPRKFSNLNSLGKHINRQHSELLEPDTNFCPAEVNHNLQSSIDSSPSSGPQESGELDCFSDNNDSLDLETAFNFTLRDFVFQLQSKSNITLQLVSYVMIMVKTLISGIFDPLIKVLNAAADSEIPDIAGHLSRLPTIADNYSAEFKRLKVLRQSGCYCEPIEHVVGTRTQAKHQSKFGCSTAEVVEVKMYYVPLDNLLSVVFSSQRVLQMLHEKCTQQAFVDNASIINDGTVLTQ